MELKDQFKHVAAIVNEAVPIYGAATDYDELIDMVGDARLVLLGESTHGTHEFYRDRAEITRRLITEKGFSAVAVEADWPDAYRVNRFVRGVSDDRTAEEALTDFERFPTWMWANREVADFVTWLKSYNETLLPDKPKAGFYGLDLYSLYSSISAVLTYLDKVDPEAARRAHNHYSCFEHFGEDPQAYGYMASANINLSCEDDVVAQLVDLQRHAAQYAHRDGRVLPDDYFFAEQNARVILHAEEYYRSMFQGRDLSWNLRDSHMADTVDELLRFLDRQNQQESKIVIWEHNSHIGDARATEFGQHGQLNVGQLLRQRYGHKAKLIGFTTYWGTVTAASDWGGREEVKTVNPGLENSVEALFHDTAIPSFFLPLQESRTLIPLFEQPMLERAIGVIYLPHTERISHYFYTRLALQFDGIIHIDRTRAVTPLVPSPIWKSPDLPETYPTGL